MASKLSYVQAVSSVNPSFWNKLTEIKLNVDKLSESPRPVWGYFTLLSKTTVNQPLIELDSTSFNSDFNGQNMYVPFKGKVINKNTVEDFKECNKQDVINTEGKCLCENIVSGEAIKNPVLLNSFLLLTFADLKKYHYYYWFSFPVPSGLVLEKFSAKIISEEFNSDRLKQLYVAFQALDAMNKTYFIIENQNDKLLVHSLSSKLSELTAESTTDIYFAFFNISMDNKSIGSQLRNYAALILHHCPFLKGKTQKFVAVSVTRHGSEVGLDTSVIYNLLLPDVSTDKFDSWVGWEKNERDKMGPRVANMKNTLDPKIIAENSVYLNLKLMKWRIVPDINLEVTENAKCLLIGAGTLGCAVARCLLGWGVRNITFADNGYVSHSNPVRQSLYTYEDALSMKAKSEVAPKNLEKIFPGVNAKGVHICIPMPGHSVGESMLKQTVEAVQVLTDLIKDHDIIFLLTDSRESRWLPTLLGCYHKKIVINSALGFDSYLVMRHGCSSDTSNNPELVQDIEGYKIIDGDNLGCYFCNDVTAPGDSMKNRTLDQQCTVTRPGVAQIAGALAVELAVSILQHEKRIKAPAFYKISSKAEDLDPEIENQCILGLIPHSIRGFLSSFNQMLPATMKYDKCVACSDVILNEYKEKGIDFLLKVFDSSKHLEDVTKLTEMLADFDMDELQ
ncbi:ubiquitin-like modifier-activating enzyme ATG7 isoform X2 [Sitophilus oryzae]|uniref:Ubiquitin-like modifier-activating enzyme ATG7 n=1 Tax=Sitophilus oryzae TaxID=7048 RepID=A0A6J2YUT4_SITOR|nr:ubiquitin-like modifier-activating enzyme ATG7 isoform X2 [Sitophilus oryzae]